MAYMRSFLALKISERKSTIVGEMFVAMTSVAMERYAFVV
jgi:hypothetical protein